MMEILDLTRQDDSACTMRLAFRCDTLDTVTVELRFYSGRLDVDISVANDRIRHLFEDEIYDFLYRFKRNRYTISSLNIHLDRDDSFIPVASSCISDLKEKWLKAMNPHIGECRLDAFA